MAGPGLKDKIVIVIVIANVKAQEKAHRTAPTVSTNLKALAHMASSEYFSDFLYLLHGKDSTGLCLSPLRSLFYQLYTSVISESVFLLTATMA